MYYTGVGSRETPINIQKLFVKIGKYLAVKGFTLRSGHAKGADQAFEKGCDLVKGKKEIYLPWKGFEGSDSNFVVSDNRAFEIAFNFHSYWNNLSNGARKLQARNSHQVLGLDLDTPSSFIICWTEGGMGKGGTGQAIRIAEHYDIPVFDVGKYKDIKNIRNEFIYFTKNYMQAN